MGNFVSYQIMPTEALASLQQSEVLASIAGRALTEGGVFQDDFDVLSPLFERTELARAAAFFASILQADPSLAEWATDLRDLDDVIDAIGIQKPPPGEHGVEGMFFGDREFHELCWFSEALVAIAGEWLREVHASAAAYAQADPEILDELSGLSDLFDEARARSACVLVRVAI